MSGRMIENNRVSIVGEIVSNFEFSHKVCGEKFYTIKLSSKRESGTTDVIPITISERLADVKEDCKGILVNVKGQFRSYNKHEGDKNHLVLSVFARDIEEIMFEYDENQIFLDGFICKQPIYRKTPFGREIADLFIAVNRPYGKSDYIPCIAWGRNAKFASSLEVGTHIGLEGRIQSREYQKRVGDNEAEVRTVYEVSVSKINIVEETEDSEHEED